MQEGAVLEMRGICKYFPGVKALQHVDFTLREGEIHALMGENGAGKSTLIKVLTGVYEKDGGEIYIKGHQKAVTIKSPQDAQNVGISTVYQEITLCPNLTVAENMYIGRTKGCFSNWKKMNEGAAELLRALGIPASPTQQLGSCSIAVQQMVAIARAVDMDCKVLILDEPTSSLDEQEVAKLFTLMKDLQLKGVGIIFVTHFLDQVYEVCDRITVLRDGQLEGEYPIAQLPRVQLVSKMLGKELDDMASIRNDGEDKQMDTGTPVLEVSKHRIVDDGQRVVVDPSRNGTSGCEHNQRGNHGLDLEVCNQSIVECTEQHSHNTASKERNNDGRLHSLRTNLISTQDPQHHGTGNGNGSANRNILSTRSGGNQSHTDGQNDQFGSVVQNGNQVSRQDRVAVIVLTQCNGKEGRIHNQIDCIPSLWVSTAILPGLMVLIPLS